MRTAKKLKGGCSCGAVRYALLAKPIIVHCCHCTNCQRQTGSAFVINAVLETANIEATGDIEVVEVPREYAPHDIHRCRACKVAVWSDYGRRPGVRFVRTGTLDDPWALKPDVHIHAKAMQPWVKLAKSARVFREFYDPKKVWNAESRRRWAKALSGGGK